MSSTSSAIANSIVNMVRENRNITDIQIRQDAPLFFRKPTGYAKASPDAAPVTAEEIRSFFSFATDNRNSKDVWETMIQNDRGDFNCAITVDQSIRLRINGFFYGEDKQLGASIRCQPVVAPGLDKLGVPEIMKFFVEHKGLVLVTGPTSAGKSTTLASTIEYLNKQDGDPKNIITIEDPIEYQIKTRNCIVTQRELGAGYLRTMNDGVEGALRQAPNVIMIGEARDKATFSTMIRAASTGHLVLASMHSNTARDTVESILNVYAGDEATAKASALASCLVGIISQQLVPSVDGSSLLLATEVLIVNDAVRNTIREKNFASLVNLMNSGRGDMSSYTLNAELMDFVRQKLITPKAAITATYDPDDLKSKLEAAGLLS